MVNVTVGISSFRTLREENLCYVDKTAFIEEFLSSRGASVSLITRPRRFGKSLTMSMLAEFFDIRKDSRALFSGLHVSENEKLCAAWMNKWPVLAASFRDIHGKNYAKALFRLSEFAASLCGEYLFLLQSPRVGEREKSRIASIYEGKANEDEQSTVLSILCHALSQHYGKKVLVLIDEYDVPIAKAHANGYYEDMYDLVQSMLSTVLKDNSVLKFGILTGCLSILKESAYTGLNNIQCFDIMHHLFADKIGFTSEDVEKLLEETGLSYKKDVIREWYDGYCFGNNQDMYCPWDILRYVADLKSDHNAQPRAYWLDTSKNECVRWCIEHMNKSIGNKLHDLLNKGSITAKVNEALTYDLIGTSEDNLWTLLFLTGYLTKSPAKNPDCVQNQDRETPCTQSDVCRNKTLLRIPNNEIRRFFTQMIDEWWDKCIAKLDLSSFLDAFWKGDGKQVTESLSAIILKTVSCFELYKEQYYHTLLTSIFYSQEYEVVYNTECGYGFSDLLVMDEENGRAAVIEFKRTSVSGDLLMVADGALKQINDRKYDIRLQDKYETVLHWGMAFCRKLCLAKSNG